MTQIEFCTDENSRSKYCNQILRSLPCWFGIESAIVDYVNDVKTMDTWLAIDHKDVIGFISINKHSSSTAEIHVMGIEENHHRKGIGDLLIKTAEKKLAQEGFRFLTVKTLSESHPDENYKKTRLFYLKYGFSVVEEFKTLWSEDNPCLFLIKPIQNYKGIFKRVEAVMIHVPDPKVGIAWYQKAFSEAKLIHLPEFDFDLLELNGIKIEVVQADEKVGAGAFGLAVDWEVESFDEAFKHLTDLGATLYRGPMKIEAGFRMCKLKDPFGNLLGLRGP